jgi:hypothetical protein
MLINAVEQLMEIANKTVDSVGLVAVIGNKSDILELHAR